MYDTTAILRTEVKTQDAYLNDTTVLNRDRTVFCRPKSVRFSEYYEAATLGLKPELVLVLASPYEYQGERVAIIGDVEYTIMRVYQKPGRDTVELTLARRRENAE